MSDKKVHELKCKTKYFNDFLFNGKDFELRKNDRDFKIGDFIRLHEIDLEENKTGKYSEKYKIKYILYGGVYGLDQNYVILGLNKKFWRDV